MDHENNTLFHQPIAEPWHSTVTQPSTDSLTPAPRFGHTAVVRGDAMIVFAGRNTHCYGDVCVLDLKSMTWSRPDLLLSTSPCARAGHTACCNENSEMYIFGGVKDSTDSMSSPPYLNDLWVLNLEEMTWTELPKNSVAPQPRKGHTAVSTNGSMHIYGGGQDDSVMFHDLWRLEYSTGIWREIRLTFIPPSNPTVGEFTTQHSSPPQVPLPRMYHVAVLNSETTQIVFGGRSLDGVLLNDLFEVNLETGNVHLVEAHGDIPSRRMCSTAVFHNGVFAVFTGGSSDYLPDSHQLDMKTLQWEHIPMELPARTRPTTVLHGNTMITFGGCVSENNFVNETLVTRLRTVGLVELCLQRLCGSSTDQGEQNLSHDSLTTRNPGLVSSSLDDGVFVHVAGWSLPTHLLERFNRTVQRKLKVQS